MHAKKYLDVNQVEHIPEPHDLITWRVSAYAVVTHGDKILLVKEAWSDSYELPGGGIESGEAITSGVIRECQEETGVPIALTSEVPFYMYQSQFVYTKGEHKSFHDSLCLFFKASAKEQPEQAHGDAQESIWTTIGELNRLPIQSMHREALRRVALIEVG